MPSKSLFSQHYLTQRIQEHPEWAEDLAEPFTKLRALYEGQVAVLAQLNEAQTEAEFIRPALEILGFSFIPQTTVQVAGRAQRPDYALFASATAKAEASAYLHDEPALYARALAIADAKYWGRPLSVAHGDDPRDEFKNSNPSFQIVNYLIGTSVDWGLLTNGRCWRLYYRLASSTATEFYEVDLAEIFESGDPERFKYFWLFFRRQAFVKDPQGRSFLERVREGSATYARVVGDRLKEVVFRQVFPRLAGGFVAQCCAQGEEVAGQVPLIYQTTLSLLYKLLFLFYAEARKLLPTDNPGYHAQSLTQMASEVAARLERREPLGERSTALYDHLLNLFRLVDEGDRGLGIPRYNGGLFRFALRSAAEREKHADNYYLTQHHLPDALLAPALDQLARSEGEAIDYGYLGVRHLGAIYEGLLEHRLVIDDAPRAQVHLETDKGERKATGSYYTPDYVVKYIVRHTLGPILEERARRFQELMDEIAKVRKQLADGRRRPSSIPSLRAELEELEQQAREALLDIKVCDPAMGSGHFLVEAVDYLTDGLIDILNRHPEHNPVLGALEKMRQGIAENLAAQGIAIPPARLEDTQLLQRLVMKRCIYGVDLNPMAVELAKVSLWLHSFTVGAPLSFLDHHLRCGNSLIGAMARQAEEEMAGGTSGQLTFLSGPFSGLLRAAEIMRGIGELADATFNEVETSEQLFRQFDEAARPYKQLLDIHVARHFGLERADEFLRLYGADTLKASPDKLGEPYTTVVREARRLYQEKRFFHWDLEFPEVFIDLGRAAWKENPGFDVVVGNPPYVRVRILKEAGDPNVPYLERSGAYKCAVHVWDVYMLFVERALHLAHVNGNCSFIVPIQTLHQPNSLALRELLLGHSWVREVVDLSRLRVFEESIVKTCILVYSPTYQADSEPVLLRVPDDRDLEVAPCQSITQDTLMHSPVYSLKPDLLSSKALLTKIAVRSTPLGEHFYATFGLRSCAPGKGQGGKDRLILDSPSTVRAKPYMEGREIARYDTWWAGRYIDYIPDQMYSPRTPHLFEQAKLVSQSMLSRKRLVTSLDTSGMYVEQSLVCVVPREDLPADDAQLSLLYVLAFMNSAVSSFYFSRSIIGDSLGGGLIHATPGSQQQLPIRRITFSTPPEERARHLAEAVALYEGALKGSIPSADASPLQQCVAAHLAARPERADVVHDFLAHLAGRMIALNKEKQAEVKGFLAWLERELGAPLEGLTGKSRLQNYLGDYQKGEAELPFEELLQILRKNARRLRADPQARAFQERLECEYRESLSRLLPLKAHLATTDRLIDRIVYQLYGLTEEEVAIVESRVETPA